MAISIKDAMDKQVILDATIVSKLTGAIADIKTKQDSLGGVSNANKLVAVDGDGNIEYREVPVTTGEWDAIDTYNTNLQAL